MTEPTVADVVALQRSWGLNDLNHVVWIGETEFVLAHTDEERATIDLEDCKLHNYLLDVNINASFWRAMVGHYYMVTVSTSGHYDFMRLNARED